MTSIYMRDLIATHEASLKGKSRCLFGYCSVVGAVIRLPMCFSLVLGQTLCNGGYFYRTFEDWVEQEDIGYWSITEHTGW